MVVQCCVKVFVKGNWTRGESVVTAINTDIVIREVNVVPLHNFMSVDSANVVLE